MSVSNLDFSCSGISMRQEVKLLYAAKATRGNRFYRVSTTPGGRGLLLLGLFWV